MNLKLKKTGLLTILPILMLSLFNDDLGQAFAESQIEKTEVETTVTANDLDYIMEYKVNDDEDIPERSAISRIKLYISSPSSAGSILYVLYGSNVLAAIEANRTSSLLVQFDLVSTESIFFVDRNVDDTEDNKSADLLLNS